MKRQISLVDNSIIPKRTVTISPLKRSREDDDDEAEQKTKRTSKSTSFKC